MRINVEKLEALCKEKGYPMQVAGDSWNVILPHGSLSYIHQADAGIDLKHDAWYPRVRLAVPFLELRETMDLLDSCIEEG